MSAPQGAYPMRVRIALVLFLVFAAVSSARWLRTAVAAAAGPADADGITAYEARFHELARLLPAGAVVGYLADPVPPELPRAEGRAHFRRYLLAQYALTPTLVLRRGETDFVVGNFQDAEPADSAITPGLERVRDFGDGVLLLRRVRE